LLVRRLPNDQE